MFRTVFLPSSSIFQLCMGGIREATKLDLIFGIREATNLYLIIRSLRVSLHWTRHSMLFLLSFRMEYLWICWIAINTKIIFTLKSQYLELCVYMRSPKQRQIFNSGNLEEFLINVQFVFRPVLQCMEAMRTFTRTTFHFLAISR